MAQEIDALPLIRTKLQRPRLPGDLIPRRRLLDRLDASLDRKLILVSAVAGAGKTTLLAQWLEEYPQPSAWLSLDEHDNDPIAFSSYLCGAIQTVFPSACDNLHSLLNASPTPPPRVITALIVNELDELLAGPSQRGAHPTSGFILVLDDYHTITEPAIHEILASLIQHLPQGMRLALATRTDPWLPLARLRACKEMTEVRSADLRFTPEEAHVFLRGTTGRDPSPETIRLWADKTEGWVVGLRLAALSMRDRPADIAFVQDFEGTGSDLIAEYFASEVLARQSAEIQDFALRTAVLDRFCAPLCEALTEVSAAKSQEILEWIARANLFLVPLGDEDGWYRYHPLFRDILRHELEQRHSAAEVSGLHARAGAWFAQHGWIDEGLNHLMAAGDTVAAVSLVARQRYALMNRTQWARLDQVLHQFSPDILDQYPDLLMLKTWLLYHGSRFAELAAALQRLEAAMSRASLSPDQVSALQGEISALRSLMYYHAVDPTSALTAARQALEKTPHELWIVRIMARMLLAGALLMMGDESEAYSTVYTGFEDEGDGSNPFKATLLATACNIHWMAADLQGLAQAAAQCITLSQDAHSPEIMNQGHNQLGRVRYQHNELAAAERHFSSVVQQPYLNYGGAFAHSACGLALTHQAQGRPEDARAVAESAVAFMLETGNTTLLPVALAFQAELAVMQGQVAMAGRWAARLDPVPSLSPMYGFFSPHLTLVKVWLAQDTPASRARGAELLDSVQAFCESTHTTRFLIEARALQALLHDGKGDEPAALAALQQAIALAEPGGFVRLFVDLGPPMARLLEGLYQRGVRPDYISRILAAFPEATTTGGRSVRRQPTTPESPNGPSSAVRRPSSSLIEPLTPRESEVLALLGRHLSNKEIAKELVISPDTVKSHTLSIYRKLDVRGRQQAAARAREWGLL